MTLMDGGNTGDNAPDVLILSEILKGSDLADIKMLSIGAGNSKWTASPTSMVNPCVARAGLSTITIVFSAGEDAQVYKARRLLGDNYFRIVPDLGNGIAIDDAKGCLTLIPPAVQALFPAAYQVFDNFTKGQS